MLEERYFPSGEDLVTKCPLVLCITQCVGNSNMEIGKMNDENDKAPDGFSRKIEYNEVYLPRVQRSKVREPIKWNEEWDSPNYVEGPEEKRPIRSRRVQHKLSTVIRLGTMQEPTDNEEFTREEQKLLKKLKGDNRND